MNLPGHDAPNRTRTLMSGPSKSSVGAPASVIRLPDDFSRMEPGTIPVCPTTTPAWTPLFSQARGSITDVGGVLTHGSIVTRKYALPTVLGTGVAIQRIRSGQMVRLDGNAGTITFLDHKAPAVACRRPCPALWTRRRPGRWGLAQLQPAWPPRKGTRG